jgi:DNA primase
MDFGAIMLGHDPSNPGQFRQAALKLADLFSIECKREGNGDGGKQSEQKHPAGLSGVESPITQLPTGGSPEPQSSFPSSFTRTIINEPIDFVLKNLDPKHPYLSGRGFTPETIEHFGLGFCSRGLMKDRIAVPIHDPAGRLVGYAGRLVDDAKIDETHPKYLLPGRRERDGTTYEFHKSLLLYNLHRIGRKLSDLIIVEGFASTWWLHQCGFWDNVALMGGSCSDEQANLIAAIAARVWIMSDGDDAGENCAESLWQRLGTRLHCRHVKLDRGRQPTDVPKDDLHRLFKQNHKD